MLYQAYQLQTDLTSPLRLVAQHLSATLWFERTERSVLRQISAACDVIALTSDSECFALVQVEAMLCGTPVVMTDTPGGRVPVRVTGMGRLAKRGDHVSIGEAISAVLDDPAAYSKTRAEVEDVFSFQRTVDQYEEVFRAYAVDEDGAPRG